MPALPRFFAILFFTLFTLALTNPAHAAPGDLPNPQPCKNPISEPPNLVDHYITDDDGEALIKFEGDEALSVTGLPGQKVILPSRTFSFTVDFSKLQSLFANSNSNFLEGETQSSQHRFADIIGSNSQDRNEFFRAIQKTSQKTLLDKQRKDYVEYVYNKPELAESGNQYTDIYGQGEPKTIYDLVTEFGLPNPPQADDDKTVWLATWGKYWSKIPTAWSEFYEGEIVFHYLLGQNSLKKIKENGGCPLRIEPPIRIVLPEFYRTASISDQLNRQLVAKEAQSYQDHGILAQNQKSPLAKVAVFCWELIKNSANSLKKVVRISLDFLNPVDVANAQEPQNLSCLKPLNKGKEGQAPYCPLPFEEANKPGVSCPINKNDPNKLEQDNPNVICTFTRTWTGYPVIIDPNSTAENNAQNPTFDSCTQNADGTYTCSVSLQIYPNIRIPWLAAIWNDTLYSDEDESLPNQKSGRPGIFGFATPKSVRPVKTNMTQQEIVNFCQSGTNNETELCQKLAAAFDECFARSGFTDYGGCLIAVLNLPANTPQSGAEDPKERFMGAVEDPGKNFTKACAFRPKAIQEILGSGCKLQP